MGEPGFRDYAADWWRDQKDTVRRWWWLALLIALAVTGIRAEFRLHVESAPQEGEQTE